MPYFGGRCEKTVVPKKYSVIRLNFRKNYGNPVLLRVMRARAHIYAKSERPMLLWRKDRHKKQYGKESSAFSTANLSCSLAIDKNKKINDKKTEDRNQWHVLPV